MASVCFLASWAIMMGPIVYRQYSNYLIIDFHTDICASPPSHLGAALAVHGSILWLYWADALLLFGCKSNLSCFKPMQLLLQVFS